MTKIAPSILSADFSAMGDEIRRLEVNGADWIHCDVMDGVYVTNITFGMPMVKAIRPHTTLPLDVHLMITEPEKYVERFCDSGADYVTFHPEASRDPHSTIEKIHAKGVKAGIVLNPDIPVSVAEEYIKEVELVLLMSVFPGYGGQSFIPEVMDKITQLKGMIERYGVDVLVEIDGGVNLDNAGECISRGVDVLVAGNTVFSADDMKACISALKGE
ncbi:MAG: ribulose-phosphate 3-epimerase [Clostridia bacterium]|nr:ribulose-phosphate 3-epimerase [Clostridia bacterium]